MPPAVTAFRSFMLRHLDVRGKTVTSLAQALGSHQSTVSNYLRGHRVLRPAALDAVATELRFTDAERLELLRLQAAVERERSAMAS